MKHHTASEWNRIRERLGRSQFRSNFSLPKKELSYINKRGMDTIREHAVDFLTKRLAPAYPRNDGKQTPFKNHPVFIAQHATGTCCRGCLQKWHHIPKGTELTRDQVQYIAEIIVAWIRDQVENEHK